MQRYELIGERALAIVRELSAQIDSKEE